MGVSILWEPVNEGFALKDTGAASDTVKRLEETFGEMPIDLNEGHCFALNAMTAASGLKAYANLSDLIHEHGPIRVFTRF